MRNSILLSLFLLPLFGFSQSNNQETIAKFIITDARHNDMDITPAVLEGEAYTVFYTSDDDGLMYMANVWPNSNSQSYGPLYGVESEKFEETYENYKADFFYFNWKYQNSYDSKSGTAKVQFIKIYKPQGVAFSIRIIPENLDETIFKGYMEGTIDFGRFNSQGSKQGTSSRFRKDYKYVSFFINETEKWSDWEEGDNTFVINDNENGDITHYRPNGDVIVYKKISKVEEDYTDNGQHFQVITALDETGARFQFQIFDDPAIGLKLIYKDVMIQFADF